MTRTDRRAGCGAVGVRRAHSVHGRVIEGDVEARSDLFVQHLAEGVDERHLLRGRIST
jgi:hypothetical protein